MHVCMREAHALTVVVAHALRRELGARRGDVMGARAGGEVRDPGGQARHVDWGVARCVATRSDVAERMRLLAPDHGMLWD